MRLNLNFLNSILGIRLLFLFGVIIPLSVIPYYLNPDFARFRNQSTIWAFTLAQQAYFTEYSRFEYSNFKNLEIPIDNEKYYQFSIVSPINTDKNQQQSRIIGVIMTAFPQQDWIEDWYRSKIFPLVGVTIYDTQERVFMTRVCMADRSEIDLNALQLFSSNMAIYPYQKGINLTQENLTTDDIFPCPDGFMEIR